jgi:hypothetical protein
LETKNSGFRRETQSLGRTRGWGGAYVGGIDCGGEALGGGEVQEAV